MLALLLLLGLMVTGWALLRARPVAVASPVEVTVASPASPAVTASPTPSQAPLVVHVWGAVRRPGLVRLAAGARVQDALAAAGGLRRTADPGELNLAQVLADGQQIVVGTRGSPLGEVRDQGQAGGTVNGGTGGGATPGGGVQLDLNRAGQAQLEGLPGVGPVTAVAILAWRQQHGRFTRVQELQEIDGIGPKTFARIAPHVRV